MTPRKQSGACHKKNENTRYLSAVLTESSAFPTSPCAILYVSMSHCTLYSILWIVLHFLTLFSGSYSILTLFSWVVLTVSGVVLQRQTGQHGQQNPGQLGEQTAAGQSHELLRPADSHTLRDGAVSAAGRMQGDGM